MLKLCADSAMQIDVDDALRGHVFAVQDALFWVSFIVAITVAATIVPPNGHSPALVLAGSLVYLVGCFVHAFIAWPAGWPAPVAKVPEMSDSPCGRR